MNKKIFTLLVGAGILISSLFTVRAQTAVLPYSQKPANDATVFDKAYFNDILTADPVIVLEHGNDESFRYVLSVTGLANPTQNSQIAFDFAEMLGHNPYDGTNTVMPINSRDSSIVMFVDSVYHYSFGTGLESNKIFPVGMARLRLENLAKLDTAGYEFDSWTANVHNTNQSKKLEAIRRASWCLKYTPATNVAGSNVVFDFTNAATGLKLAVADWEEHSPKWNYPVASSYDHGYYNEAIDLAKREKMYQNWRFSQTVVPTQPLQQDRPLYIYSKADTIAVLVLNIDSAYIDPKTTPTGEVGGYTVSMKHVSVKDLMLDATGDVKLRSQGHTRVVENVLLFTIKKVNTFVMNADDWNAVSGNVTFERNATLVVENENQSQYNYLNPFQELKLKAYEVNDSLYHYGYMNFKATQNRSGYPTTKEPTANKFLYVDTGFVNVGNNMFLAFGFDAARRDSTGSGAAFKEDLLSTTPLLSDHDGISNVKMWGDSFVPSLLKGEWKITNGALDTIQYVAGGNDWTGTAVYWELDSLMQYFVQELAAYNNLTPSDLIGPSGTIYWNGSGPVPIAGEIRYEFSPEFIANWDRIMDMALLIDPTFTPYYITTLTTGVPYTIINRKVTHPLGAPYDGYPTTSPFSLVTWWVTNNNPYYTLYEPNTFVKRNYKKFIDIRNSYTADSVSFIYTFMKDSIVENQSKFRVVYDPFADSTFINVYQSRVRHANTPMQGVIEWPSWWTNSFGNILFTNDVMTGTSGGSNGLWEADKSANIPTPVDLVIRPSDLFTRTLYGNIQWLHGYLGPLPSTPISITEAASFYYSLILSNIDLYSTSLVNSRSDRFAAMGTTWNGYRTAWGQFEGHGINNNGTVTSAQPRPQSIFNFHSFMEYWPSSGYSKMDKVMISTADTVRIYEDYYINNNQGGLSHMYGWSMNGLGEAMHKDSLLYIDIHAMTDRIITLDQSLNNAGTKGLDTRIKLNYGLTCSHGEGTTPAQPEMAYIPDDLYLIRNTRGEYLCVPLWSINDSVYWVTPKEGENPSLMPCFQWAIINNETDLKVLNERGSYFTLVNREFEKVRWTNIFLPRSTDATKIISSRFLGMNPDNYYNVYTDPADQWYLNSKWNEYPNEVWVSWVAEKIEKVNLFDKEFLPRLFSVEIANRRPLNEYSFLGLKPEVKGDYLLGYHYVSPNDAFTNVYAFKYLNDLSKKDPRYISWRYEEDNNDTTLYVRGLNFYDRLYFALEEMNVENISYSYGLDSWGQGIVTVNKNSSTNPLWPLYTRFRDNDFLNADSLIMERYGFYTLGGKTGGQNTTTPEIKDLKPLVRQAYNLLLKDNYRWHPTVLGHYMTVGQVEKYILSDKMHARQDYIPSAVGEPNKVEGLFGVPHFYFRNTLFDIQEHGDDYFAMIQRLDTFGTLHGFNFNWVNPSSNNLNYDNLEEYLIKRFGSSVAAKVLLQVRTNREYGLFVVQVEDAYTPLLMNLRGDGQERVSTFQLESDTDPVYRRFHGNEPNEKFGDKQGDYPDTLEFRLHNDLIDFGQHLYENFGNYGDIYDPDSKDGWSGGRDENVDDLGNYMRDSLNNVISFLGMNYKSEFGKTTKYGIFVDTAFINRGSGWIKPQYLLAVDPYEPVQWYCEPSTGAWGQFPDPCILARYMFNSAQLAKEVDIVKDVNWDIVYPGKSDYVYPIIGTAAANQAYRIYDVNYNKVEPINPDWVRRDFPFGAPYLWAAKHERIAFSWAIHRKDTLWVLKNIPLNFVYEDEDGGIYDGPEAVWRLLVSQYGHADNVAYPGSTRIDWRKLEGLNRQNNSSYYEFYFPNGDRTTTTAIEAQQGAVPVERRQYYKYLDRKDQVDANGNPVAGLHAIVRLDDNTHKDWVWSMRYIERGSSDFVIESETTARFTEKGAMILPGYGGWMKFENGVPVISRTDAVEVMSDSYGAVFNVKQVKTPGQVVGNEAAAAASDIKIIGGAGTVTVLNAAGKNVIISNVLGQTLVNTTLKTDNATLEVPAGIAVVTVDTAKAAKVLVK